MNLGVLTLPWNEAPNSFCVEDDLGKAITPRDHIQSIKLFLHALQYYLFYGVSVQQQKFKG